MRCLLFGCCCYCLSLFDTGQDAFTSYRATKHVNVFLVLPNLMLLFTESKMLVFTKSIVSKICSARTKFIKLSISEKVTIGQSWCGGIHTYVRTQNNSKLDVKYLTRHGPLQHSTVVCQCIAEFSAQYHVVVVDGLSKRLVVWGANVLFQLLSNLF